MLIRSSFARVASNSSMDSTLLCSDADVLVLPHLALIRRQRDDFPSCFQTLPVANVWQLLRWPILRFVVLRAFITTPFLIRVRQGLTGPQLALNSAQKQRSDVLAVRQPIVVAGLRRLFAQVKIFCSASLAKACSNSARFDSLVQSTQTSAWFSIAKPLQHCA